MEILTKDRQGQKCEFIYLVYCNLFIYKKIKLSIESVVLIPNFNFYDLGKCKSPLQIMGLGSVHWRQ